MSILRTAGYGASAAVASLIFIGSAQAAMAPAIPPGAPSVQFVDCAVGFHIGPAGACILGSDNDPPPPPPPRAVVVDPPPAVVEHNDGGCETKSVNRTDAMGNSETRTKSNCD
jgi:hypothetical protein